MNIIYHFEDFGVTRKWKFHATSHGKSFCDGIGAIVKKCVSKASLQRTSCDHILNTEDMFNFCEEDLGKSIKFIDIDHNKIEILEIC